MDHSKEIAHWRQQAEQAQRAREAAERVADQARRDLESREAELAEVTVRLARSEGFSRELFTRHPVPLFVVESDTLRFLDVNEAAERRYGYERTTFLELTLRDIEPVTDIASVNRWCRRLDLKLPETGLWHHVTADGCILDVELSIHAVEWIDRPARLIVARDITTQHRIQHTLELHNRAIEASHNGMFICSADDASGQIEYVNTAMARLCGQPSADLVGKPLSELFTAQDDGSLDRLIEALRSGQPARSMIPLYDPAQDTLWLEIQLTPISNDNGRIEHWIGVVQDITERKHFEDLLNYQARHDQLTGLPNRELLRERLNAALQSAAQTAGELAVIVLDLDDFKRINETKGHATGDILLEKIAKRLAGRIRSHDTLARFSSDEFVLITAAPRLSRSLPNLATRLQKTFARPVAIRDERLSTSCSMGIAIYPQDGTDTETLLRRADLAMYEAKRAGGQTVKRFDSDMENQLRDRAVITAAMQQALTSKEFELHYQPQIDMSQQAIVGLEALLRWPAADQAYRRPDQFIPVAEETGLIVDIGIWVLTRACRDLAKLRTAGYANLRMAVNASAIQLRDPQFVVAVRATLARFKLPPDALEIEITESVFLTEDDQSAQTLDALNHMGVPMAIDDFGTGYSSLSYLSRLPIQRLKIDKSFIHGLTSGGAGNELVRNMTRMALDLAIEPVAEGVETQVEMRTLLDYECLLGQGYHFSPALPFDELQAWLKHWPTVETTGGGTTISF